MSLEALLANPGAVQVPTPLLEMGILRGFLSAEECHDLIGQIDAACRPARQVVPHPDPEFRTSETWTLSRDNQRVRSVEARIARLLGIAPRHGEFVQGQRYAQGQQFKLHHDFLRPDQPYWQRQKDVGGQRTWTAMVYLNMPEAGGETYFPQPDLLIPPRAGSLVAWNNLLPDGSPNPATLHQGLPVERGTKYIVTTWFRENPWGPGEASNDAPGH